MPDPTDGQSPAPMTDDAAEAAFSASAASGGKSAGEVKTEGTTAEKGSEATDAGKKGAEGAEDADTGKKVDDPPPARTAQQEAEARATELERIQAAEAVKAEADRIQKQHDEEAKRAAAGGAEAGKVDRSTLEQEIRTELKNLKLTLTDADGKPVEGTIEDFEKDDGAGFGEVSRNANKLAIAAAIVAAEKLTAPLIKKIETLLAERQASQEEAAQDEYLARVAEETDHKDVRVIVKGAGAKAFWEWHDKQSPAMQKLIGPGSTIKDNDYFFRAFKEATGYKAAADEKGGKTREQLADEQRKARKDADGLHRNTARGNGKPSPAGGELSEEDAMKLFKESAKNAGK